MTRKYLLQGTVFSMILTLLFMAFSPAAAKNSSEDQISSVQPAMVTSGQLIDLAWFYKPASNVDVSNISSLFDSYILTKNDESYRNQLVSLGVKTPILQYLRSEAIMNPGSCTATPWQNQVAYKPGDFCDIDKNHPDWFLLDSKGSRISAGGNYWQMDPGSAGWRSYFMTRAKEMQESYGWRGVFLDNVESSFGKFKKMGITLKKYPDLANYLSAIEGFLKTIYIGYFQPQGRPLSANIIYIEDPSVWFRYLNYLDGAMDEGWAVDWSSGFYSATQWEENLSRAEKTQDLGKAGIFVSQGAKTNTSRQNFAFASYLLVSRGKASFRYANYNNYTEAWEYPDYSLNLGTPLGNRFKSGSLWKRNFTNGSVTVDPVNHTATISTAKADIPAPIDPTAKGYGTVFFPILVSH